MEFRICSSAFSLNSLLASAGQYRVVDRSAPNTETCFADCGVCVCFLKCVLSFSHWDGSETASLENFGQCEGDFKDCMLANPNHQLRGAVFGYGQFALSGQYVPRSGTSTRATIFNGRRHFDGITSQLGGMCFEQLALRCFLSTTKAYR